MDDLLAFVRRCLDEDERVARAAAVLPHGAAEWFTGAEGSVLAAEPSQLHVRGAILSLDDIGEHIARWDPARVLAEVEAKRKLLDWIIKTENDAIHADWSGVDDMEAICLLAQPYAGRDGWREEWRA